MTGDFTLGDDGSLYNGTSSTDAATLTVGGSFSLGANSSVYSYGTEPFSVAGSFTLGAQSYFDDFGIMSVAGAFDPGTGNSFANDTVGGTFTAAFGSSVTTNAATWEVLAGGQLNVAVGAAFTVASGGTLTVDSGGSVTDQGNLAVAGTLTSAKLSTIVVDYDGQLSTQGAGQLNNQGTLLTWNNPAGNISFGATLAAAGVLDATANVAGTFTYTPAPDTVLPVGNGQLLNVSFTPNDTAHYLGASAQVLVNVVETQTTPTVSAPAQSATYTGSPQGYPTSAVTVTGANGLNSSDGALSFTYNGSATVPTTAGTYSVVVTFTPTDTADYTNGTTTTTWTISPATPTVHAANESTPYNGAPQAYPMSGVSVTGVSSGTDQTPSGSFSYSYCSSSSSSYGPTSTPPTHAGTYTVTVTFNTTDPNYNTGATGKGTFTIMQATPAVAWNAPGPIPYFTPLGGAQLNATANVSGTFAYTPSAGTLLSAGTQTLSAKFTPTDSTDYATATATVQLVVLGCGVTAIGTQLYVVGGNSSNDHVQVSPVGSSNTGSTGVKVQTSLNGVNTQTTYNQSFITINIFLQGGNENVQLANSLTINAVVTAGDGTDNIQLGNGNNLVTLGNGNDKIQAGNGSNTVLAGYGNDNVKLGSGSNQIVALGNGNDNVQLGDGSFDDVTIGTGNDGVQIGNGSNNTVFLSATGKANVKFGNGSNNTIQNGKSSGVPA